jgi:glyoxylase-like metal-dependent hydrolase (beta-lactamase superfamily II)
MDELNWTSVTSLTVLDLCWLGNSRSIASVLLRSGDVNILIDPGPSICLSTLHAQLASQGLTISDVQFILLTHIHLDHAGATGSLLVENPALRVYVHERGAAHLVDPQNLLKSARRLYGEKMDALFGKFLAVPQSNLEILQGGERLSLGGSSLDILYTPGHASHHVSYFETSTQTAFVGDTAGICIEGHPFVLPATPPPDIDLELWVQSLNAIEQLEPKRLCLTHFGFSNHPRDHIANYRARLRQWSDAVARILGTGQEDSVAAEEFVREATREAGVCLSREDAEHLFFNGHLPLSWRGLARYHRKRATSSAASLAT